MGPTFEVKYEHEEPWGTFQDLDTRRKYHVWVVQNKAVNSKYWHTAILHLRTILPHTLAFDSVPTFIIG